MPANRKFDEPYNASFKVEKRVYDELQEKLSEVEGLSFSDYMRESCRHLAENLEHVDIESNLNQLNINQNINLQAQSQQQVQQNKTVISLMVNIVKERLQKIEETAQEGIDEPAGKIGDFSKNDALKRVKEEVRKTKRILREVKEGKM